MKNILILSMIVLTFSACTQKGIVVDTTTSTELSTALDSASYLLGGDFAKNVSEGVGMTEIDNKSFLQGMQRVFEGKELEINEAEAKLFMQAYFGKLKEAEGASAKAEGMAYLEENMKKEGVQVTASGLQYKVITEGSGAKPTTADKVKVHYTGKLIDGTVFDSSVERGEPIEFPVTGVIRGWTEALQLMPVGSKWELVIPSELAYGERGAGQAIPSNATLIFDVELLDIISAEEK